MPWIPASSDLPPRPSRASSNIPTCGGYYRIFHRPHLQTFLDYAFAHFDVSIFTAADKDYALFIAENIVLTKPGRKLKYLFYGYAATLSENYYESPEGSPPAMGRA